MAKLPDFTALGSSPVPQHSGGIAGFEPADTRAVGAGISAAGKVVEEASVILAHANDRQDQMVAEAALNTLHKQRLELQAGEKGFERAKGVNAIGQQFLDGYQQRFDDAASEIERNLQNDNQRRMFQQRRPVAELQYRSSLMQHQARETDAFNTQTDADSVELARRQIFDQPTNPLAIDAGLTQINAAIDRMAGRKGWAPEVVAETKAKYREKVFEDAAQILVERDPAGALAAMNKRMGIGGEAGPSNIPAFDSLNPDKLVALRHRANSYVTQEQNRLKAEGDKRMKEAQDVAEKLQDFVLTGQMVDPVYEKTVIAKTVGTPYEAPARALIASSFLGAGHGSQTIPQQEASLRNIDAQMAAQGSSPEAAKLVQRAREITETQKRAYAENPWAAAARFGKQPPVQVENIGQAGDVPQLVAHRLGLMSGIETYAGRPVSPLQPEEAKAFAEKLKALPPDARAEVLAQTGAMLNAQRGAALAEQLDKHDKPLALALKMGLDRTTAGRAASALVLRGAQALADKTVKKDDTALAGWRAEIANAVRGSLGDDQAESDVIDAAYFVRAAQDVEGIGGPNFTRGVGSGAADAVAMVIGRPMERAGVKTILPRGMKENEFDDKLRTFTPEKLREVAPEGVVYVRGAPVKVEQFSSHLGEYGMKRDGAGRYIPVVRNAPVTLDAAGQQLLRLQVR